MRTDLFVVLSVSLAMSGNGGTNPTPSLSHVRRVIVDRPDDYLRRTLILGIGAEFVSRSPTFSDLLRESLIAPSRAAGSRIRSGVLVISGRVSRLSPAQGKEMRREVVLLAIVTATSGAEGTANDREQGKPAIEVVAADRIRTDDAEFKVLIAEGLRRSDVFRRLVDTIASTDGIVWVLRESCGPRSARSCLSMTMTIAGDHRIVFVRFMPRSNDAVAIASLGHELQHAIEVFSDPTVRSGAAMYFLFKRIGSWINGESFETPAAIRVGDAIVVELRRSATD